MIATSLSETGRLVFNRWALSLLLVGTAISSLAGFDIVFNAVTAGSPLLRISLFAAITVTGLFCAERVGLSLLPHGYRHPIRAALAFGALVAIAIAFIDGFLFRSILPPDYVGIFTGGSLGNRLAYFMLRAFNENIFYRLF
jgi:hypothetical protein